MGDMQQELGIVPKGFQTWLRIYTVAGQMSFAKVYPGCALEEDFRSSPFFVEERRFVYRRCKCFRPGQKAKVSPPDRGVPHPLHNVMSIDDVEATDETLDLEEEQSLDRRSRKRKREIDFVPDVSMAEPTVIDSRESDQSLIDPNTWSNLSTMDLISALMSESINPAQLQTNLLPFDTAMMEQGVDDDVLNSGMINSIETAQSAQSGEVYESPGGADEMSGTASPFSDNWLEPFIDPQMLQDQPTEESEANSIEVGVYD